MPPGRRQAVDTHRQCCAMHPPRSRRKNNGAWKPPQRDPRHTSPEHAVRIETSAYPTAPPPCQTILRRQLNHRAHASKTRYTSVMDRVHFFSAHILDSPLPTAVARAGSSAQRTQLCCRNSARQVCRALVKANGRSMSKAAPIPKAPACMTRGCPASADARGATTHEYTAQPARCTQSMYNLLATHVKA